MGIPWGLRHLGFLHHHDRRTIGAWWIVVSAGMTSFRCFLGGGDIETQKTHAIEADTTGHPGRANVRLPNGKIGGGHLPKYVDGGHLPKSWTRVDC